LSPSPDYTSIAQIWLQINDPALAAKTLSELLQSDKLLEAYQIAFDLADSAAQGLLEKVEGGLPASEGQDAKVGVLQARRGFMKASC
jgi:hypothetical protein